jgi:hypothetical protein
MRPPRAGEQTATENRSPGELDARADALRSLVQEQVPFLVAGAYAFFEYTGIFRDTKDLDVFLRRRDLDRALAALERAFFRTELLDPGWLAKGYRGEWFVDVIFSSGNGLAVVDDAWFENARAGEIMGTPVLLAPPEEIIWSKAYVCERERYDGHDIAHLLRACGPYLDWERLLARFDHHWQVLLSHVVMYRFTFPSDRTNVPDWVMHELLRRSGDELAQGDWDVRICRGPLLSKVQYQHALEHLGYLDVRQLGPAERLQAAEDPIEGERDGSGVSRGSAG